MTTAMQYRAVTERRQLDNIGLNAARVGAVDTSVLLWNVGAIVNQGLGGWPAEILAPAAVIWADETNAVNPAPGTGTTIKIARRGIWHVVFSAEVFETPNIAFGISLDAPPATLLAAANPINSTLGIVLGQHISVPANTQTAITLAVEIPIADAAAGDAARGIVRFHGNNGAGADLPETWFFQRARYRITYCGDLQGV